MRSLLALLVPAILVAGCTTPDAKPLDDSQAVALTPLVLEPLLFEFTGHIMQGALDLQGHDQPGESLIWEYQQAGWLLDVQEAPQAIEVRVDWEGDGAYTLHPHRLLGDDEQGTTQYYGYHSDQFTTSPGCIRLPEEDMAAGIWPMMVHPGMQTAMSDFTITVGLLGGAAEPSPELHGHRADGNYVITPHEHSECQFLLDMPMAHSH